MSLFNKKNKSDEEILNVPDAGNAVLVSDTEKRKKEETPSVQHKDFLFYEPLDEKLFYGGESFILIDDLYTNCVTELHFRQKQTLLFAALYMVFVGLVAPNAVSLNVTSFTKGLMFLILFIIGLFFSGIVMKNRVVNDINIVSSRTLAVLMSMSLTPSNSKEAVYKTFYNQLYERQFNVLRRNFKKKMKPEDFTKLETDPLVNRNTKLPRINHFLSFYKQLGNHDTLFFQVVVLLTGACGVVSGLYFSEIWTGWLFIFTALVLIEVLVLNIWSYCMVIHLYDCIDDRTKRSFERVINRAWMLKFYV